MLCCITFIQHYSLLDSSLCCLCAFTSLFMQRRYNLRSAFTHFRSVRSGLHSPSISTTRCLILFVLYIVSLVYSDQSLSYTPHHTHTPLHIYIYIHTHTYTLVVASSILHYTRFAILTRFVVASLFSLSCLPHLPRLRTTEFRRCHMPV